MISYPTYMGQPCSVTVGATTKKHLMYPSSSPPSSGEKNQSYHLHHVSSLSSNLLNQNLPTKHLGEDHSHTQGLESTRYPFTLLSLLVGSSSPFLESKEGSSQRASVINSPNNRRPSLQLQFGTLWTTSRSHEGDTSLGQGQGAEYFAEPPSKIQKRLSSYQTNSKTFLNETSPFCSNSTSISLQVGEGITKKEQFCMQQRRIIMNESQEERKESLSRDGNAKDKNSQPQVKHATPTSNRHHSRDESPNKAVAPGRLVNVGSAHESDYIEDLEEATFGAGDNRHENEENAECQEEEATNEPPNHFLFIGPVGKKRRHCRERRTSGDTEVEVLSPASIPPTPETHAATPDPPALVEDTTNSGDSIRTSSEDSSRSRGSGSSSRDCGREEESSCSGLVTSTPTSVIRTVPRNKRGDDQPLNLSLPGDIPSQSPYSFSHPHTHILTKEQRLGGEGGVRGRVSVINIAPRERSLQLQVEETEAAEEFSSPPPPPSGSEGGSPHYLPHGDLPDLGYEHGDASNGDVRPSPQGDSTSTDFFEISSGYGVSGGALSPTGEPSSFQGLLPTSGNIPPRDGNSSSSSLKKKILKCRDCGKEFSQLRNYKYHRSRHEGTQQFACTCPVCGKTFNDKGYLSSHLKIHRNEKEYQCEWCEKRFNQRVAYNMHIRIHTGLKPHKCDQCNKKFSRKMLLRQHIRTHTGERPYQCVICGKAFADRSNMLLHQRLHSGERPYKCHICGKSFSKNHHLKTHLNHHAGIKPYQCDKCKACFSQSSNMKTHYRKCTRVVNAPSTVTSNSLEPQPQPHSSSGPIPGPSSSRGGSSSMGMSLLTQNLSQYSVEEVQEVDILEEQQQHQYQIQLQPQQRRRQFQPEQLIGLSPTQQQLLQKMSASHPNHSTLHSQNSSTSTNRLSTGYRGIPGPSSSRGGNGGGSSSMGMSVLIPQNLSPYSLEEVQEAAILEEHIQQQHQYQIQQQRLRQLQPEQFVGLSPIQQQQLLQEMSASFGLSHRIPSPILHSPNSSSSTRSSVGYRSSSAQSFLPSPSSTSQQALGFNMGSLSLNSPTGSISTGGTIPTRSRQSSGLSLSLLPMGNSLSPTSLAAGHPFIPLNALDTGGHSGSNTPHLSPSAMPSAASMLLLSPRHHPYPAGMGDLSPSEFARLQSITTSQQRNIANRSRIMNSTQQQADLMETGETDGPNPRGGYHHPGH